MNMIFFITIRGNFSLKHTELLRNKAKKIYENNVPITLIEIDDVC